MKCFGQIRKEREKKKNIQTSPGRTFYNSRASKSASKWILWGLETQMKDLGLWNRSMFGQVGREKEKDSNLHQKLINIFTPGKIPAP